MGAGVWAFGRLRRGRTWAVLATKALLGVAAAGALGWACLLLGVGAAYPRSAQTSKVAPGVVYRREHRTRPRPHPIHVLAVDLDTKGLYFSFTVPRATDGHAFAAARTSDFLAGLDRGCVAAINASFFFPFHSKAPWDYYPHEGDGVDVLGYYGSELQRSGKAWYGARVVFDGGQVTFGGAVPSSGAMLEGRHWLVRDGQVQSVPKDAPYSRMVLALRGRTFMAVAIDGKVDGAAEGLTLRELAALLVELEVDQAVELDGGGSVTMVLRPPGRPPSVTNLVSHTRIPFRERPVATHLGICFATSTQQHVQRR